jgi:hypothetical protein
MYRWSGFFSASANALGAPRRGGGYFSLPRGGPNDKPEATPMDAADFTTIYFIVRES